MGLGILNDSVLEHVPGTVHVLEDQSRPRPGPSESDATAAKTGLKYDRSGPVPIILVPQPSDDPNDPLNWPLWRRDLIVAILCVVSTMAATLSPLLAADTLTLAFYLHRNFTDIALLTGYHLCGVGVAGLLFVASARVWGKRHLFLLGTVLMIVASAWGGASGRNYKSLLWARIFQGMAVAPFEALVNAVVGDLYCVHQRGIRMALSNVSLFGSAFFTPILVGKITYTLGWPWTFYLVAIFGAAVLPLVVFGVPETTYRRSAFLDTDLSSMDNLHAEGERTDLVEEKAAAAHVADTTNGHHYRNDIDLTRPHVRTQPSPTIPPKATYAQTLLPFNGRKTDESFFKLVLRPFPLYLHPAILWACLIQGTLIGWTVMIGVVIGAVFGLPPLFFDEVKTGYMYTGAFIGAVLGFVFSGLLADWTARRMTRRNGGVYEPEFRIVLVIPQLIAGCAGLYGFGITSANIARYGWFWPEFFFALEVMGMVIGAVASALYIVDAHRDISVEAFTCLLIFKNMFSFGLTWSAYDWILRAGIRKTFVIVGSVQVAICLLSIPMYILGKKNRSFFHRHDLLRLAGLR
ncbi:MAG: hypothetical protein M1826_001943 [Phylliscum demangeonii]|nr:MAG: hypothetical protein M1826_001943 [Phylliscum demangeonii]